MEAIFILLALSIAILYISFYKKDSTLIIFAGIFLVLSGLTVTQNGFGDLTTFKPIGVLFIFLGLYVMLRTSIEMIADKDEDGKIKKSKDNKAS